LGLEGIVNAIHVTSYRRAGWYVALPLIALTCKGSEPVAPTTGGVQVAASTSGADLDADGYTVTLDVGDSTHLTGAVAPIAVNGTVTFSELSPGSHSLLLDGAAGNCPVVGANPRTVFVTAGQTMRITFQVTCLQRADLGGVWNYVERVGQPFACIDTGSYVFTESGAGIAGTNDQIGTCDRQAGSIDNSASGPISGGTVYSAGGVHINLTVGACSYSADVAGTIPSTPQGSTLATGARKRTGQAGPPPSVSFAIRTSRAIGETHESAPPGSRHLSGFQSAPGAKSA